MKTVRQQSQRDLYPSLIPTANKRDWGLEDAPPSGASNVKEDISKNSNTSDSLLPARVEIANWATPVLASDIRLPMSESEWLEQARRRKSKFGGNTNVVYWRLVETWGPIPGNAIPTGNEGGTQVFSIRVWKDGCLTIGKQVPAAFMNSTRRVTRLVLGGRY